MRTGAFPGLHDQAPLRLLLDPAGLRYELVPFLVFMTRLHCGAWVRLGRLRRRAPFLVFMIRLHCGLTVCWSMSPSWGPFLVFMTRLHCGQMIAQIAGGAARPFLVVMTRLHCGARVSLIVRLTDATFPGRHDQAPLRVQLRENRHCFEAVFPGLHDQAPLRGRLGRVAGVQPVPLSWSS